MGLIFHRFRRVLVLGLSVPQGPLPPLGVWNGTAKELEQRIRACFQLLYQLPDQEEWQWRNEINLLFYRCQGLGLQWPLQDTIRPYEFLDELQKKLETVKRFFVVNRVSLISRLKTRGDPRVSSLALPRRPSCEQAFVYILCIRNHAQAYRMSEDGNRLPGPGDRRNGHLSAYAAQFSHGQNQIKEGTKIGRKLTAIEDGIEASGISLVVILVSRKLDHLTSEEVEMVIWLLGIFNQYPEILELARDLSPDMESYQDFYNYIIAGSYGSGRAD